MSKINIDHWNLTYTFLLDSYMFFTCIYVMGLKKQDVLNELEMSK